MTSALTSPVSGLGAKPAPSTGPLSEKKDAFAELSQNYETFLKLLTTQLQNQDPLKPQDSSEFTKQLVTFSQVEQQISSNKKLDTLINADKTAQAMQSLNYLGSTIEYFSDTVPLSGGKSEIGVTLDSGARTAELVFTDNSGRELSRRSLPIKTETQTVNWDGRDANGNQLPDGSYKVAVIAKSSKDEDVASTIRVAGKVNGVDVANGEPKLLVGSYPVAVSSVLAARVN
jgi:flagellar basal-body rod modification protein FlgD